MHPAVLPTFGGGKIRRSILLCKNELLEVPGVFSPGKILNSRGENMAFGRKFRDLLL